MTVRSNYRGIVPRKRVNFVVQHDTRTIVAAAMQLGPQIGETHVA